MPAPPSLDDDTALEPAGEGVWKGAIAPGWDTPRGPLGGYVMAILIRGLELAVADSERTARSVTAHFLRVPEAGPVTVSAHVERQGRSVSTLSGRLEQDGKLIALGLAAYSKPWPGPELADVPMPEVEPPEEERRPLREDFPRSDRPPFLERLSMEHRFGPAPFSSAEHAEVGGWLGLLERRPLDAGAIAVLADAWFPAPWARLPEFAPAPTIELTIHFRSTLPLADSVLLGRFRSGLTREGFFDEDGQLWLPDGTLVAESRQLGLLLGARA
jgi:acyl-CoA thioesterase